MITTDNRLFIGGYIRTPGWSPVEYYKVEYAVIVVDGYWFGEEMGSVPVVSPQDVPSFLALNPHQVVARVDEIVVQVGVVRTGLAQYPIVTTVSDRVPGEL